MAVRYRPHVAIDPQGRLITELVGIPVTIVAAGTTTPLPISEDSDGSIPIAGSQLTVTSQNIIPGFWVQDNTAEADAISGPYRVSIDSLTGVKELALDSAASAQAAADNIPAEVEGQLTDPTSDASVFLAGTFETPAGAQAKADAAEAEAKTYADTLATAAGRQYGRRWVYDGDSITLGAITTNAENQDRNGSWTVDMAGRSQGRIHYVYNAGVGGQTLVGALARFDTYVAPYTPEVVMLSIGTNDIGQGRTLAEFLADLDIYWANCQSINADLILGEIFPKSVTQATIAEWNDAIHDWAEPKRVLVVPFSMLGKADGSWPDGWTSDGVHPLESSPALSEIGRLAWESVEPYCGPVSLSSVYGGENLASNGFMTSEITAPVATITAGLAATTGALPAGTYEYRVVGATFLTRSTGRHSDASITLAAPGGVTLTRAATGSYNFWLVFRRDPTSLEFKFLAAVSSNTATWTDDGSVTPLWAWRDDTLSTYPTGWNAATGPPWSLAYGSRLHEVDGVRGKVLRGTASVRLNEYWESYFDVTGLTAGGMLEVSALVRGPVKPPSGKTGRLFLRWRSSSAGMGNTILLSQWIDSAWRRITFTAKVPTGADRLRFGIGGEDTWPYLDVAELSIRPGA